jgi:hypothetical protein
MTQTHTHEPHEREPASGACGVRLAPLYAFHSVLLTIVVATLVIVVR